MADGRRGGHLAIGWLVALIAASSGCKWLPVRHPERDRKANAVASTADRDEAELPPLPEMRSIGDDEAFRPAEPTPLLAAAASRDAAIKQAIALSAATETPSATTPPTIVIAPRPEPAPPEVVKPDPPKTDRLVEPASFSPPLPDAPKAADPVPDAPAPEGSLWDYVLSAMAVAAEVPPSEPPVPTPVSPTAKAEPEFTISDLRVCRRVLGFGRTEGLAAESVVAGRTILLYCELEGVHDEEVDGGVRSRLASSVAILPESGGEPVWSFDLGVAEDHCRRRRRDFFVNYRVKIPESLAPGVYQVRLVQSDLLAGRTASRSVPITVRAK